MSLRKISQPKTMTTVTTSDLKDELLKWICERHATNGPLDRQLLRDKALELATSLGINGFKCSEAWLTVFLKKHGFSPSLTNCNGPHFPDYRVWIDLLRSLITQYRHKDLFNVDELVMYSDVVPSTISSSALRHRNQHGDGLKKSTETSSDLASRTNRIGMLICCNSSGTEKLRPLISGPYDLRNAPKDCRYHRNESACIADDIFGEWLARLNEEMTKASRKILLLLSRDRIRSLQCAPELSNVNLLFFPKDFPTQLRPLRGDVFHCTKMMYRSRYVEHISSAKSPWKPEEIVVNIVRAWKEVPRELIVSSFQRTKFREDESCLKIECPAWENLGTGMSFRRFVTFDDDLTVSSCNPNDDLAFLNDKRHQYNLRRSRRDTVDLDVIEEITPTRKPRGRKASKRNTVNQKKNQEEATTNYQVQGSSGLKKRRKTSEDVAEKDHREEHMESQTSETSETSETASSNDENGEQSLVERIEDFLENAVDPTNAEENDEPASNFAVEATGTNANNDNVNDLINDICQRSDNRRSLMERCLRAISFGNHVDTFTNEDIEDDSSSREGVLIEEVDSRRDENEDDETSPEMREEEIEMNFPGEAGPSGSGKDVVDEAFGAQNSPKITDFDDADEEIPITGRLKLKILEAIECCDEIERSNAEETNHLRAAGDDNNPRTSKRARDCPNDDDDEPAEKRAKTDCGSWSKRYETNFVFGPEHQDSSCQSVESSVIDQSLQCHEPVTKSKKTQTRNSELEKRYIFTLDGNAPSVSFPTTKD